MLKKIFIFLIKCYKKLISPFLGKNCRFYPTCSNYAHNSIKKHGVIRGLILGIIRILKCNPLHKGGYDPIPDKFEVKYLWKQKDLS